MEILQLQKAVDEWIKKYGVRYFDEKTNMLILMEEVGELARLFARKYGEQSFKNTELANRVDEDIREEMGDCLFVLVCLANQIGLDLASIMDEHFEKMTGRDSERHLKNPKLKDPRSE